MRSRAEVFKAMVAEFPAELRERLAQAVTEAELRLLKEPKPVGPSDDELVATLKDRVRAERPNFTLASPGKIVTVLRQETGADRARLTGLLDRARRELAVDDHAEILASAVTGAGVMALVEEFGILQEDAARIIREVPATTDEEIRAEGRRFLLANPSGFPGPRALTDHLVAAFPTVQRRRIDDIVLELMQAEIGPSDSDLKLRALLLYDETFQGNLPESREALFNVRRFVQPMMQREFPDVSLERIALALDAAERVILARAPRPIPPPLDEALIRRFIKGKIDVVGEVRPLVLVGYVVGAFPEARGQEGRIRDIVDEVLDEVGVGKVTPEIEAEIRRLAEEDLRQGTPLTGVLHFLNLKFDTIPADTISTIVRDVQEKIAADMTDVEVLELAKTFLAQGKSITEIVNILVRSVLAGDVVRANRIVGVLREEAEAARAEGLASGRAQAVTARETLATIKAETAAEVTALTAERDALFEQIREIEQLSLTRPRDAGVIVRTVEEAAQISALTDKVGVVTDARRATVLQAREKALEAVSVKQDPARQGDISIVSRVDAKRRQTWDNGVSLLRRLVPPDVLDGFVTEIKANRGGRAFYRTGDGAFISKGDDLFTVIHELGHAIEYYRPEILKESIAWREARTVGEREVSMRSLFPKSGYKAAERTKVDKFFSPYIGKTEYGSSASEVLSMGLEELARDPMGFAERDPDMFDFIFAVIRKVMDTNPIREGRIA